MRYLASTILLAAFSGLASAQTIDPNSVSITLRQAWCKDQQASCPLLCLQQVDSATTRSNTCQASSLAWTCVCSDGTTPNVSEYSQTVPYYECTEWGTQCVAACGQDNTCSSNCRQQHPCGAQSPKLASNTTSTSSSATSSTSATASSVGTFGGAGSSGSSSSSSSSDSGSSSSGSGSGSSSSTTTTKTNAAQSMVNIGRSYGVAMVAGGIFVSFSLLL